MRAVLLLGQEHLELADVPEPALKAGEVRVQVQAALTCGTDLKVYRRGYHARMLTPPCVFGHEFSGSIVEIADSCSTWKIGDRVVAANSAPCGSCPSCRRGQQNLCDDLLFLNGAYAESIVIPARIVEKNLLRLKPETNWAAAALTEPLACVVLGIEDLSLHPGESLLILGAGPIGLMGLVLAKAQGVSVTVAGRNRHRLERAHQLGADQVLDLSPCGDEIPDLNLASPFLSVQSPSTNPDSRGPRPSEGWDAVFEAVGKPTTWQAAIQSVRKGGRVNWFGGCPSGTTVPIDTTRMHYSSLELKASFHHRPHTIRKALDAIESGVVRPEGFIDGTHSLEDVPSLFKSMTRTNRAVKTCVLPPNNRETFQT